jgi:hypothetical protein
MLPGAKKGALKLMAVTSISITDMMATIFFALSTFVRTVLRIVLFSVLL